MTVSNKMVDLETDTDWEGEGDEEDQNPTRNGTSLKHKFRKLLESTKEIHFFFKSPMLLSLSITFLVQSLNGSSVEYIYQLASQRFNWSLSDVCL